MPSPIVPRRLALFGDHPVRVRDVLDVAFASTTPPGLRDALTAFVPNTDPRALSACLSAVEDRPFPSSHNGSYRFSRLDHRWRLLPAKPRLPA